MSGAVSITLDTTAPEVTWGGVSGAMAGELLVVGYTLDEDASIASRVRLPDGRTLDGDLFSDRIQALLPPDAPEGLASVELDVLDDVGNAATRTHSFLIRGTAVPLPPLETVPGMPRPRRRAAPTPEVTRHRVETRTRIEATSTTRSSATCSSFSLVVTRDSSRVLVWSKEVSSSTTPSVSSATRSTVRTLTQVGVNSSSDRRRRDDEGLLALLL